MSDAREQLCECGLRLVQAGLSAGAGGNISVRDGSTIWMSPSGYALSDLTPDILCGIILDSGEHVSGDVAPTTERSLHLAVYRMRSDINAVFHTHPPWLTGVISAGVPFRPLTTESVGYLGRVIHLPYALPQSEALADQVEDACCMHETLLLPNHGIVVLSTTCREALHRSLVAEDTAKSIMAAALVGAPQFLSEKQISELNDDS
jgi:ribulose-5-phosphate 4-epimerase/fuculose-1-phosphate aldolase